MPARRKARKRALDLLYEAEQRGRDPRELLGERAADPQRPVPEYTAEIVSGVADNAGYVDEILATYSHGWSVERMPAVDRALLRMGVWELLYNPDVPADVAVSEAVGLATDLSTDDSPAFVNGLLGRVAQLRDTLAP